MKISYLQIHVTFPATLLLLVLMTCMLTSVTLREGMHKCLFLRCFSWIMLHISIKGKGRGQQIFYMIPVTCKIVLHSKNCTLICVFLNCLVLCNMFTFIICPLSVCLVLVYSIILYFVSGFSFCKFDSKNMRWSICVHISEAFFFFFFE